MPAPTKGPRLAGGPAHERLMLANLATALFEHGRITTTETKAKRLRPLAERLITFAKKGDLHARRQVLTVVRDKEVVHTLFAEIGPQYAERRGGYTRITKIGPRKGDNAPMAVIELVEGLTVGQEAVQEADRARSSRFARRRRWGRRAVAFGPHPSADRPRLRRHGLLRLGATARSPYGRAGARGGAGAGVPAARCTGTGGRGPHRCRRARDRPGRPRGPA